MKLAVFNTRDYEQTLINTARGPIIDTQAVIKGLQSGKIAYLGLDVYEHERGLFFCDHSGEAIIDLSFNTLVGLDNVLLTGHQAFLTKEALHQYCQYNSAEYYRF